MGGDAEEAFASQNLAKDATVLRGLPAAGGVLNEATVRVLRDPATFPELQTGEVAVVNFTNSSFNAYMGRCGAIVTNMGGSLYGAGAGASLGLLRSIFKRFDTSGDGVISRTELQKGLCLAGVDFSDADYRSVMADMDIDHDGQVSIAEFAHAICGGMDFDDSQHEYYRHQNRPNKPLAVLRDDFAAVPVSLLSDVFHALRRAGHDRHVPVAVLAEELNRKALLDVTPGDLDQVAHDGALTLEALYAALFA